MLEPEFPAEDAVEHRHGRHEERPGQLETGVGGVVPRREKLGPHVREIDVDHVLAPHDLGGQQLLGGVTGIDCAEVYPLRDLVQEIAPQLPRVLETFKPREVTPVPHETELPVREGAGHSGVLDGNLAVPQPGAEVPQREAQVVIGPQHVAVQHVAQR
eukprot:3822589-Rhodomonas_salina.1